MELEEIAKNYEKMPDFELIRIATKDAYGLRPEVFEIIELELKKRNLDVSILNGAIAQNKKHSKEEIKHYASLLAELSCPICGSNEEKLNGTTTHTVKSFIFFTSILSTTVIACPDCLDKKIAGAIQSTALLGWWGIPWGLLKTPFYIYKNYRSKQQNRLNYINDILLSYTLANIGQIEAYQNNKIKLQEVINPT
jgi:hypothetical protein